MSETLTLTIKNEARRLGFALVGVTLPAPPQHLSTFERWLAEDRHGTMAYLADETSRARRADPRLILPECQSILVLGTPYHPPARSSISDSPEMEGPQGGIAAYAWGKDYHLVLPERMKQLVAFIEAQVGHPIPNRWYTDTGPILERDLAQRAGLGWIGKNTCLINPRLGSTFFLSEILLGLELEPDVPFTTDQCGTCTRCLDSCPTQCILPDRTLDARRCISSLPIEKHRCLLLGFAHDAVLGVRTCADHRLFLMPHHVQELTGKRSCCRLNVGRICTRRFNSDFNVVTLIYRILAEHG